MRGKASLGSATLRLCVGLAIMGGLAVALVSFGVVPLTPPALSLTAALLALIVPTWVEEIIFRGPLIWTRRFAEKGWLTCLAYVLWHPLLALAVPFYRPWFWDPTILGLTTVLGVLVTWLALSTQRLWPGVLLHWATVVLWLGWLGGPPIHG